MVCESKVIEFTLPIQRCSGSLLQPRCVFQWIQENVARNPWQVDTVVSGYSMKEQRTFLGLVDRFGSGTEREVTTFHEGNLKAFLQDFVCCGIADSDALKLLRSGFRAGKHVLAYLESYHFAL